MVDTPQTLALALAAAGAKAAAQTRAIVKKGAVNVKNEAKANVQKSAPRRNAHAHLAITFDEPSVETRFGSAAVGSEIGYDKDKPGGALGNLLEFGGGGDKSPAHRDLGRALDNEEPRLEAALVVMATGLLN